MTGRAWLASRVALALALMIGFYTLALGLAGGLLWLAYAQVFLFDRFNVKLVAVTVVGGLTILWSLLPRFDKFEAPGPRVAAAQEPQLFAALQEIATTTDQEMPAEVYIINDVNAWVAQRGGVMGIGSRRIMGLGLPLMEAVTVQEFKGILAHEFGHYCAGDVKLGPWIHKTRGALGRTINQLSGSLLQKIFLWYGAVFLRITHAVSRRQEFIADEVAARAAGAAALASGLRKTHGAALAFQGYWQNELAPVLGSGYLPPVSQGFARFMQAETIAAGLQAEVTREEAEGSTDPYDTHPSLRERVAALAALPQGAVGDRRPATSLLSNIATWERRVMGMVVSDEWARGLKPLDWEKVIETVYLPVWQERATKYAALLQGINVAAVPSTPDALAKAGAAMVEPEEAPLEVSDEERSDRVVQLYASAVAVVMVGMGWQACTEPGEEIVLRRGSIEFRPFSEVRKAARGELQADEWRSRCASVGIADLPLATVAAART